MPEVAAPIPRALLVSIRTPDVSEEAARESLKELERLVDTLGFRVIATESQARPNTTSAVGVGRGKLKELARYTGGKGVTGAAEEEADDEEPKGLGYAFQPKPEPPAELATVVVFDCDLRPSQFRHLENALGCEVLDRTGVIIEIFSRHAKTRAARLQVEIARLNYVSPRLREVGSSGERQSGRGSGESALATGRRAVRDRIAELKKELEQVQLEQAGKRQTRAAQPTVALVGYTNAGKSSTMRALTGSEVLVENKLFATLDTTVRALKPDTQPRILISDTVGFIKKLPHDLVASFRSTLDEALSASLLLYVVDSSDPTFRQQLEVVDEVLREVGVLKTPTQLVLNKIDLVSPEGRTRLAKEFPQAVQMSSLNPADVKALHGRIQAFFEQGMREEEVFVPYAQAALLGEVRATGRVISEKHGEEGTAFLIRASEAALEKLKKSIASRG